MTAILYGLLSILGLLLGHFTHPTHARCPRGWYLEGVRPSGLYDCRRAPIGDDTWDVVHGERDRGVQPDGVIVGRVYCQEPRAEWSGEVRCETERQARR